MKLELTKAQAQHIKYLMQTDMSENAKLLSWGHHSVDKRACRNDINLCQRILDKMEEA